MRLLFALFFIISVFLTGCAQESSFSGTCGTNVVMQDNNIVFEERVYVSAEIYAQGFVVPYNMTIKRVMMNLLIQTGHNYKLTLTSNPRDASGTVISQGNLTVPSGPGIEPLWFDLTEPIDLEAGVEYFLRFENGGGFSRVWYGNIAGSSLLRTKFYEKTGSNFWTFGDAGKGLSIGLAGNTRCN